MTDVRHGSLSLSSINFPASVSHALGRPVSSGFPVSSVSGIHLMKRLNRVLGRLTLGLFALSPLSAQRNNEVPRPVREEKVASNADSPEREWADVKALLVSPRKEPDTQRQDPQSREKDRRDRIDRLLHAADAAKAFAEAHPEHAKATEAKQLEAKSLLRAAMAGDSSRVDRAKALIAEIRRDARLPAKERVEVVALSEFVRIRPLSTNRVQFEAEHEKTARALIAEFPSESAGYQALLQFGINTDNPSKLIALAKEIVASPTAPAEAKIAAEQVVARHALVGKSLANLASEATVEATPFELARGRPAIVYTWTSDSRSSHSLAKTLASLAGRDVLLIGVNLDTDRAAAESVAAAEKLPGSLYYDAAGADGVLARSLFLTHAPLAYVTNASGILCEVSGHRGHLMAKLSVLTQP